METGTEKIRFSVRGIGLDQTPGCFVCGGPNSLYNNTAAFVNSRSDGRLVVNMFDHGAWLDYRPEEPRWIQVKIGACNTHLINLRHLVNMTKEGWINRQMVEEAVALPQDIEMEVALTAENVVTIFNACLFREEKDHTDDIVNAEAIRTAAFSKIRLKEHVFEIASMLLQLPRDFHKPGGASFLVADSDKQGIQWTGEHRIMDMLFLLGIAIGKVKTVLEREYWSALPGGMPFYSVNI